MHIKITYFEIKKPGEDNWQEVPEKMALEKLADCFDPVTPIIARMLEGNEIVADTALYRMRF
jgi:hypothetical protein